MDTIRHAAALSSVLFLVATTGGYAQPPGRDADLPLQHGGPYDRLFHPENLPTPEDARAFPHAWEQYGAGPVHNAAFDVSAQGPQWLRDGVSWNFAEARAWPLSRADGFDQDVIGERRAMPTLTQFAGNAVGVSVVDGIVYAESDDQFAYAVNARTGKLIWRFSPTPNTLMGTPLVSRGRVYLSAGSVAFNFSNVQQFAKTRTAVRGGGVAFSGIYALDARSGKYLWHFGTQGEAMPTPAISQGRLFFVTGGGNAYALDAATGKQLWKTQLRGMANMSSPMVADGRVFVAMSSPGHVFSLDAATGKILWKSSIPGADNTGIGDVSPVVADGVVLMDAVADAKKEGKKTTMDTRLVAFDAKTGRTLWQHNMGRGPKPPAFKGGMPMVHDGIAYVGTPVNNIYQAYELKSGKRLWTWHVPDPGPAGSSRGPATYYQGALYISTGPDLYALDPKTGKELGRHHVGGRFGIVNPVIVGGTMYLSNSYDWLHALPVTAVNPGFRPGAGAQGPVT